MKKTTSSIRRMRKMPKALGRVPILSVENLRQSLMLSYTSERIWNQYLHQYHHLFCDADDAEIKARTHSLAITCRNIRNQTGYSFQKIYSFVLKEVKDSNLDIDAKILRLENKWEFMDSIFEI